MSDNWNMKLKMREVLCALAQSDWTTCKLPTKMVVSIDKFLKTPVAKKNNIFSRTDFLARCAEVWLSKYEKEYKFFNDDGEHMSKMI